MKRNIFLAFVIFTSVNAFAGAYNLTCSNNSGTVTIGKGTLSVNNKNYKYYNEYSTTRLMGLDLVDFLKTKSSKVVIASPYTPSIVAPGSVKVISESSFNDECGNTGTVTKYSETIGIYYTNGNLLVNSTTVECVETIITGHCK